MDFLQFNMIDKVIAFDAAEKTIVCSTKVPEQSFVFDAHFPGFPILPGVFMIETIAQTAGMLSLALSQYKKMAFLFGVEETRFRDFVPPGSLLTVQVKIVQQGAGYVVAKGEIYNTDKLVANAEVRLRLVPVPNPEIEKMLVQRAHDLQMMVKVNDVSKRAPPL